MEKKSYHAIVDVHIKRLPQQDPVRDEYFEWQTLACSGSVLDWNSSLICRCRTVHAGHGFELPADL